MPSSKFVILALSDTHIGHPKYGLDWRSVLRPLIDDVERQRHEIGVPNLVVFTGDLAFGAIPGTDLVAQYSEANKFIDSLFQAAGADRGVVPLVVVPGNHDLDRSRCDPAQTTWRDSLSGDNGVDQVEAMMRDRTILWRRFLERQQEWNRYVSASLFLPQMNWDADRHWGTLITECSGLTIGVAAFNTSWAAEGDADKGRLWLGKFQMQSMIEQLVKCDLRIALTHHPTSWLHEAETNWVSQRIETNFDVLFHGHDHESWLTDQKGHLRIAAGAAYQGSQKPNSYVWLTIDVETRAASIRFRGYTDSGSGGWIPKSIPGRTDDSGCCELTGLVRGAPTTASAVAPMESNETLTTPQSVAAFAARLQDTFFFRWEPSGFTQRSTPIVYWPVRLRQPTPIHAAQAFAAAGLQKAGADVQLWIDDLGNFEFQAERFVKTVQRWFQRAGGDPATLDVRYFAAMLGDDAQHAWPTVRKWLGTTSYRLDKVLRVAKLWPSMAEGSDLAREFSKQRPRRLLTPAAVWACLMHSHSEAVNRPFVTLGGYDEQALWEAWRDCIDPAGAEVGHLYGPELRSTHGDTSTLVHMARTNMAWSSKEDIRIALDASIGQLPFEQTTSNHLIGWSFQCGVLLPEYLTTGRAEAKVGETIVRSIEELRRLDAMTAMAALVDCLERWVLP